MNAANGGSIMIKTLPRFLSCVTLLIVLITSPRSCFGQDTESLQPQKLSPQILAFLEKMKPNVVFRGKVIALPEALSESLKLSLYLHRFTIVSVDRSLGIGYMENKLIIVTDAKSGEVVSSLWEWASESTGSFKEILSRYPEANWWEAVARLNLFANLILYPVKNYESFIESRVGSIRYDRKEKAFTVELIKIYTPYLLLRVEAEEVDDHYKFGRISFIDAATGKEK